MSKAGYNKLLRKLQESYAENSRLRTELERSDADGRANLSVDSSREWRQALNRADSIGLSAFLVGTLFVLIVPTVWYKVPAFVLMCLGFAYFIWLSHWSHRLKMGWKIFIIVATLGIINYEVIPQFAEQWRLEHLRSELVFTASAPGNYYPDGDHYGIQWGKEFAEVRLTVKSKTQFPIQNLNLSVRVPDQESQIGGMALADQESRGCAIRRPRLEAPSMIVRLGDGRQVDITSEAGDKLDKVFFMRDHYDLLCERISEGESIPLVIATVVEKTSASGSRVPLGIGDISKAPDQMHVTGGYEMSTTQGNKRIPVDEVVTVFKLPRLK